MKPRSVDGAGICMFVKIMTHEYCDNEHEHELRSVLDKCLRLLLLIRYEDK